MRTRVVKGQSGEIHGWLGVHITGEGMWMPARGAVVHLRMAAVAPSFNSGGGIEAALVMYEPKPVVVTVDTSEVDKEE